MTITRLLGATMVTGAFAAGEAQGERPCPDTGAHERGSGAPSVSAAGGSSGPRPGASAR